MDNVWSLHKTLGEMQQGLTTSYYHCRLVRKTHQPKQKPEPTSPDQKRSDRPPPKRQIREGSPCQMKLKVVRSKPNQNDPTAPIYTITGHSDAKQSKEHTHTLLELDALKRNSALRDIAKAESSKGYAPAAITHVPRGVASETGQTDLEAAVGRYLTRKDIHNAGMAWRQANPDPRNLHPTTSLEIDLSEAGKFLSTLHYRWERISSGELGKNSEPVQGLVWGHPSRLAVLQRRGVLVHMDATHNTNMRGWPLFTLMVRDEHGEWCACAHFLASNQTAELISGALTTIKRWCQGLPHLRYFLTDDSAAKQSAVKKAFPGLLAGELEVSHFLCTVHSMRTLDRKLKAKKYAAPKKNLLSAMFGCTTKPGCLAEIQAALVATSDAEMCTYIEKEWLHTSDQWALYARQHSPLLLQVTTTNPVEAWHRRIKYGTSKGSKSKHGFKGCCITLHEKATQLHTEREAAASKWRGSNLSGTEQYLEMHRFPVPIQKLLLDQSNAMHKRISAGKVPPTLSEISCSCGFFRKFLLPCKHIFHSDYLFKSITSEDWTGWAEIFEEGGYEVYETMGTVHVRDRQEETHGERTRRKLEVGTVLEGIRARFFELKEEVRELEQEEAHVVMTNWVQGLTESGQELMATTFTELLQLGEEEE